ELVVALRRQRPGQRVPAAYHRAAPAAHGGAVALEGDADAAALGEHEAGDDPLALLLDLGGDRADRDRLGLVAREVLGLGAERVTELVAELVEEALEEAVVGEVRLRPWLRRAAVVQRPRAGVVQRQQ